MKPFAKSIAAVGLAGALALTLATPSEARSRWVGPAVGFAAGAVVGAAIANSSARYYDGYAYAPGYAYDGYAYAPGPVYDAAPAYESYGYAYPAPRRYYRLENARERQLRGGDY